MPEKWEHFTGDGPPEDPPSGPGPSSTKSELAKYVVGIIVAALVLVGLAMLALAFISGSRAPVPQAQPSSVTPRTAAPTYTPSPSVAPAYVPPPAPPVERYLPPERTSPSSISTAECYARGGYPRNHPSTGERMCYEPPARAPSDQKTTSRERCVATGGEIRAHPVLGTVMCYHPPKN